MFSFGEIFEMGYFDDIFGDSNRPENESKEGEDFYMENGYRVLTERFLVRRGYCCANGCRHCPYWPKAQKGNTVLRDDFKREIFVKIQFKAIINR